MKLAIKIFITTWLVITFGYNSYGRKLPGFSHKFYDSLYVDSALIVTNDLLSPGTPPSGSAWKVGYQIPIAKGQVILALKNDINLCLPKNMTFSVNLHIKYWTQSSIMHEFDTVLTVNYTDSFAKSFKEKEIYVLDSTCYTEVRITSLSSNTLAKYFYLEARIEEERYYANYNPNFKPSYNLVYHTSTDEIEVLITDSLLGKVDEYDVEYTYYSAYTNTDSAAILPASSVWYSFKKGSTRIVSKQNSIRLTNIFDKGYLIFRVRSICYGGPNFEHRIQGKWSISEAGFVSEAANSYLAINSNFTIKPHEPTLGWQLITEFAEDLRKKEVITYYDGSMRGRQTVTRNFTDSTAIVGETIYDFEGRPAINILPSPTFQNKIKYYSGFNLNSSGQRYSWADFEQTSYCESFTDSMTVIAGASKYYSKSNPKTNASLGKSNLLPNFNDYIPVANGYPFSRTEYVNDNSGRIRSQGGVGLTHQVGSGHETKYYYSVPFQEELDRLFGSEVGQFVHYKKNMVVDPNGQVSVSYQNASGKTIATALSAASPSNMDSLNSNLVRSNVKVNLVSHADTIVSDEAVIINRTFTVDEDSKEYKFYYSVNPEKYFPACNQREVCYNCIYNLEIDIFKDDCGVRVIKGYGDSICALKRIIGNGIDTVCDGAAYYSFTADTNLVLGSQAQPTDTFFTIILERGSYTLTKTLKVNQEAYEFYLSDYLKNRVCKTREDFINEAMASIDSSGCEFTCEVCLEQLGTKSTFLNSRITDKIVVGKTITSADTIAIESEYDQMKLDCEALCKQPSICDGILNVLKRDVSPGGQYAQFTYDDSLMVSSTVENSHNILINEDNGFNYDYKTDTFFSNRSVIINGTPVTLNNLSLDDFIKYWKPEYADHIVSLHPEYCKYQNCIQRYESENFDNKVISTLTYKEASDSSLLVPLSSSQIGCLDPYFQISKPGANLYERMKGKTEQYLGKVENGTFYTFSMWEIAVSTLFCSEKSSMSQIRSCVDTHLDTVLACKQYKDAAWSIFKSLYFSAKHQLMDSLDQKGLCYGKTIPVGFTERFPFVKTPEDIDPSETEQLKSDILQQIIDTGATFCESYKPVWAEKLSGCNLDSAELELILDSMVSVCKLGCDLFNPYGASTVSPKHKNNTSIRFKSFKEVLTSLLVNPDQSIRNIYVPGMCDDVLITMPGKNGHNFMGYNSPFADTCACNESAYNSPLKRANFNCKDTINTVNSNCPCTKAGENRLGQSLLTGLSENPNQYKCNTCASCEDFRNAYQLYFTDYDTFNLAILKNRELFRDFMNNHLKFNLDYHDYLDFAAKCVEFPSNIIDSIIEVNQDTILTRFRSIYMVYKNNYQLSYNDLKLLQPEGNSEYNSLYLQPFKKDNFKIARTNIHIKPKLAYLEYKNQIKENIELETNPITASTQNDFNYTRNSSGFSPQRQLIRFAVMSGGGSTGEPALDTCGCNKILSARKIYNQELPKYETPSDAFAEVYNDGFKLENFDSLYIICCKAANGLSTTINWATLALEEPCQLPNNWSPGNWSKKNSGTPAITHDSILKKLSGENPGIKMPHVFSCKPFCKVKPDTCACNKIMEIYQNYYEDSLANNTTSSFSQYFSDSVGGDPMPNIYALLHACEDAISQGAGFFDQVALDNLEAFNNNDSNAYVPKFLICGGDTVCKPEKDTVIIIGPGGGSYSVSPGVKNWVGCEDIKKIIDETCIANNITTNPFTFFSNAIVRDSILYKLNKAFDTVPFNRSFDYQSLYTAIFGSECFCFFNPHNKDCKPNNLPIKGRPVITERLDSNLSDVGYSVFPLTVSDTCGNCYRPTPLLGLVQQWLDTLTHNAHKIGNNPYINKLCRNNWFIHPNYPKYYNSPLYTGTNASSLKYKLNITRFNSNIQLEMNDQNGNNRKIDLAFMGKKDRYNWQYVRKIYDIRPLLKPGCDTNMVYFVAVAVLEIGNVYIPPTFDTVTIMGVVSNQWQLATSTNCSLACLKLCNKPIEPEVPFFSDPCYDRLTITAKINGENAWQNYKDSIVRHFKYNYYRKCISARNTEKFEMRYNDHQYHYTLYYYDQAGNLVKTVPPQGVTPLNAVQTDSVNYYRISSLANLVLPNHSLVTHYRYNTLNQVCWQKTPDAGASNFYYDALGRVAISQNAKQISGNYYSYTLYDDLGRIAEVGELRNSSPISHDYIRVPANLTTFINNTFKRQITNTYYDNTFYELAGVFEPENLRNRVVSSTYREYNTMVYDQAVHYSYDVHGNVKTLLRETPALEDLGQNVKIIAYDYDLGSGKVNKVSYQAGAVDEYYHTYDYDNDMRLIKVYSGPSLYSQELDARYYYYLHGPLARTELGQLKVQGVDYAYTLQGWLKGVNGSAINSNRDIGKDGNRQNEANVNKKIPIDVFGFTLSYFEGDYQSAGNHSSTEQFEAVNAGSALYGTKRELFNGNIAMMTVAIKQFGNFPIANVYGYDQLNRLKRMNTWNNYDSIANTWSAVGSAIDAYRNEFTYDANGNILTQVRNGSPATPDLDNLTYHYYSGTNRLKYVDDVVSGSNYADDIDDQSDNNYQYDAIGNLMRDAAEQIDTIFWNVYGKISRIKRVSGSNKPDLEFYYTPDGHRYAKVVIPKTTGSYKTYTYYVRDAQGNVMAVYNRDFDKVIYFDSLQYAAVNDSLIKYAGSTGFANFIGNLHANEVYNANFANHMNLRLDSSSIKMDSFLRAQNPINLINLNSGYFANLVSSYNSYDFLSGVANGGGIDFNTLLMNLCQCMEVNSSTVGYSLFGWFTLNTDNLQELAAAMYIYNSTDLNNLMASIGYGGSGTLEDMQDFISNLTDLSTITSQLSFLGYENCDQLRNCLYSRFRSDPSGCILSLSNINSLKQLIAGADYSSCTQPGSQLVVNALFSHKPQIFWDNLIANENDTDMVIWYKQNELQNYYYTLALYNKYWISDYQKSNNMYSSTGTGMEAYFTRVKNHFGQSFYDNLLSKFMNASKTYVDSFRLSEQHIYGSSRLGIYNQYVPLAYRYFNATASGNELNAQVDITINISTISYSLFSVERGKKSYELSNHLGNVLTVISDKRVITCQSDTIAYYSAEIISATDYSPFGAPLPGRTFSGDGYRFSFNGQERDDEIAGVGNIMTAEFWEYDSRTGKRWNTDPVVDEKESPYATNKNNPIANSDPDGNCPKPTGSVSAGFSLNLSLTFRQGRKSSNYNLGFATNVTGIGSVGNFSAQGSLNFSMMFTNGGLTKPFGKTGSSRSELIFSPAINIGGGTADPVNVNYLHNNATTALFNPIKYSATYAWNKHFTSDSRNQTTATYGFRAGAVSGNILEDVGYWFGADGKDRYWTGSGNLNFHMSNGTDFTIGTDTYTGESINNSRIAPNYGDIVIGGTRRSFNKGEPFYWANQGQLDGNTGFYQSLNNAQTFFQMRTGYGMAIRMTSIGPMNFWSQNVIHDAIHFHHFQPANKDNGFETTVSGVLGK